MIQRMDSEISIIFFCERIQERFMRYVNLLALLVVLSSSSSFACRALSVTFRVAACCQEAIDEVFCLFPGLCFENPYSILYPYLSVQFACNSTSALESQFSSKLLNLFDFYVPYIDNVINMRENSRIHCSPDRIMRNEIACRRYIFIL